MKKNFYVIFLIALFLVQCKVQQENSNKVTSYEYVDGSGNRYAITSSAIVYSPVTPEESSSGTYSGGEPYNASIEENQFKNLQTVFQKAINNTNGQIEQRPKGSGMLLIKPENKSYIFDMNSTQKKEIEDAIKVVSGK